MGAAMTEQAKKQGDDLELYQDQGGTQYLTFQLAREDYGVEILRVQEIRGWDPVTRVPNQADYLKGVLNLRGSIVPIFDLRLRFGLPFREYTKDTVVIVVRVEGDGAKRSVGMVVDGVSGVLNATLSDIKNKPDFGGRINTEWIMGLASAADKMIMLLDVDRLFDSEKCKSKSDEEAA